MLDEQISNNLLEKKMKYNKEMNLFHSSELNICMEFNQFILEIEL